MGKPIAFSVQPRAGFTIDGYSYINTTSNFVTIYYGNFEVGYETSIYIFTTNIETQYYKPGGTYPSGMSLTYLGSGTFKIRFNSVNSERYTMIVQTVYKNEMSFMHYLPLYESDYTFSPYYSVRRRDLGQSGYAIRYSYHDDDLNIRPITLTLKQEVIGKLIHDWESDGEPVIKARELAGFIYSGTKYPVTYTGNIPVSSYFGIYGEGEVSINPYLCPEATNEEINLVTPTFEFEFDGYVKKKYIAIPIKETRQYVYLNNDERVFLKVRLRYYNSENAFVDDMLSSEYLNVDYNKTVYVLPARNEKDIIGDYFYLLFENTPYEYQFQFSPIIRYGRIHLFLNNSPIDPPDPPAAGNCIAYLVKDNQFQPVDFYIKKDNNLILTDLNLIKGEQGGI